MSIRRTGWRRQRTTLAATGLALILAGCGRAEQASGPVAASITASSVASSAAPTHSAPASKLPPRGTPATTHLAPTHFPVASASMPTSSAPPPSTTSATPSSPTGAPSPAAGAPVIVIDPGHSVTVTATDPTTGLNVSDYENEPEMRDVFAVAEAVRAKLLAAGYRVVMTKNSVDQPASLGQRAATANAAHAALALSIHDQAGANGGIGFNSGNNIVYYQSVGSYRATPSGNKIYFTNSQLAARSKRYGQIFAQQRAQVEGHQVVLQGDVGYDLGSRGLAAGDIWMVQLLSDVPWIYNEAGGNSAGTAGLSPADAQTCANALVASVEHCIPPPR